MNCPNNTFYNDNDKICFYYENYTNSNDEKNENINNNTININTNLVLLSDNIQTSDEISTKPCHDNCKECTEYSSDEQNMKCISCKNDFIMIFGTNNCVNIHKYPNYFIYLDYLYPCSSLSSSCYECNPYLSDYIYDICLSCIPGYIYNKEIKRCEACKENEYPISIENFDNCIDAYSQNCELYTTYCISLKNEELEKICMKNNINFNNFNNEKCMISNKKQIIFINWFKEGSIILIIQVITMIIVIIY